MCVYISAMWPSECEVDSKKPVNLPRTNCAREFWLPAYYVHSNDVLLLRKDDTPGHSLMRHSPTTALTSASGSVNFHSTLLLSPTANMRRNEETSCADEVERWHFRLLFRRWLSSLRRRVSYRWHNSSTRSLSPSWPTHVHARLVNNSQPSTHHPTYAFCGTPFVTHIKLLHVSALRCHTEGVIVTKAYKPPC